MVIFPFSLFQDFASLYCISLLPSGWMAKSKENITQWKKSSKGRSTSFSLNIETNLSEKCITMIYLTDELLGHLSFILHYRNSGKICIPTPTPSLPLARSYPRPRPQLRKCNTNYSDRISKNCWLCNKIQQIKKWRKKLYGTNHIPRLLEVS